MSLDMFEDASQVSEAITGYDEIIVKRIIQMALISCGLDNLLVDPDSIGVLTSPSTTTLMTDNNAMFQNAMAMAKQA